MPLTLSEFADELDQRQMIWPQPLAPVAMKATAFCRPLPGIRAVLWDVYGTLLRVTEGRYRILPEQEIRLQVALDKTIHEFNMWNYLYRKPGPPWQSLIGVYRSTVERMQMRAVAAGDTPEVNLVDVWAGLIIKLLEKDYPIDEGRYGPPEAFAEKVAYFFHSSLQGLSARDAAAEVARYITEVGYVQGCLADGQSFTTLQLQRCLSQQAELPSLAALFRPAALVYSSEFGVRKPSGTLFQAAVARLAGQGISADQILHVSCRLQSDLIPARKAGMKTALLIAEKDGLEVAKELLRDPATRPDRLLTDLEQLRELLPPL